MNARAIHFWLKKENQTQNKGVVHQMLLSYKKIGDQRKQTKS